MPVLSFDVSSVLTKLRELKSEKFARQPGLKEAVLLILFGFYTKNGLKFSTPEDLDGHVEWDENCITHGCKPDTILPYGILRYESTGDGQHVVITEVDETALRGAVESVFAQFA